MTDLHFADSEARTRSWIDDPADDRPRSSRFVIRGWCYHPLGGDIKAVRATIGAHIFPGIYGKPRPDVAAAFDHESATEYSGFEIPAISAISTRCDVDAQLSDGSWRTVQSIELAAPESV